MIIPEQGEIMKNRLTGNMFEVKKITDQFVILYSLDGLMQIMTGKKNLIHSFEKVPQDETIRENVAWGYWIKEEKIKMRKLFIFGIALFLALSQAGWTLAQEKAQKGEPGGISKPATEKSTEGAKSEEAKGKGRAEQVKQASAKGDIWRMGGLVTAVEPQAKTISVRQETVHHDRVMKLKVDEKVSKKLSNLKPGDLVNVWVNGKAVTALNKVSWKGGNIFVSPQGKFLETGPDGEDAKNLQFNEKAPRGEETNFRDTGGVKNGKKIVSLSGHDSGSPRRTPVPVMSMTTRCTPICLPWII
jgi:hypothetical protein